MSFFLIFKIFEHPETVGCIVVDGGSVDGADLLLFAVLTGTFFAADFTDDFLHVTGLSFNVRLKTKIRPQRSRSTKLEPVET